MNKYLLLLIAVIGLTSCIEKDENYYRMHPKELHRVLEDCENKMLQKITCQKLEELRNQMSRLAYQLQSSPQGFGNKILTLQQTIAKQKELLKKDESNEQIKIEMEQNERQLVDMMSVVKWLESPEG